MQSEAPRRFWPFPNLVPLSYHVILADPPWSFRVYSEAGTAKSPEAHYATMSMLDLERLPVGHLAAPDCMLMMWATWPLLPRALKVMQAWGFTYKTGGAWTKRTPNGHLAFGTGYILRSACEPFLIGTIGSPRILDRAQRNAIDAERREHSRKPDETYELLEALDPRARRCELFARQSRPGWEAWGDEIDKFDVMY